MSVYNVHVIQTYDLFVSSTAFEKRDTFLWPRKCWRSLTSRSARLVRIRLEKMLVTYDQWNVPDMAYFLDRNGFASINRLGGTTISRKITCLKVPNDSISALTQFLCDAKLVIDPELLVHDLEQRVSLMCHLGPKLSDAATQSSQPNTSSQSRQPAMLHH